MSNIFEISNYDTKKILNRSGKEVSQSILNKIENGITIEELESFDYPVFKYKTQITIHGLFPKLNNDTILGYKTLIQNKNLSIGVKWNGIDSEKKNLIQSAVNMSDNKLRCHIDSQGCILMYNVDVRHQSNIESTVKKYKFMLEDIKNLYFGNSRMYLIKSFLGAFVRVEIVFNGIYTKNLDAFIANVSDFNTVEEVETAIAKKEKEQKEKSEKLRKEFEKKRIESLKKAEVKLQEFKKNTKLQIIKEIPKKEFTAFYFVKGYDTYYKIIIQGYYKNGKMVFLHGQEHKPAYGKSKYCLDTINKRLQNKLCDRVKIEAILDKVEVYLYKIFN
jgi:hypothetical protein